MAEMGAAQRAETLRSSHTVAIVGVADDVFLRDRLEEAWPTGAGIEFCF